MRRRNKPEDDYQQAAQRLNLLLSGPAHDIFALDVYYHKRCYTNFVREKEVEGTTSGAGRPGRSEGVKEDFLRLISKKILQEKKAYFLTELIQDIAEMSSDAELDEPFVKYGYELKDLLTKSFGNQIAYYKEGVTSKVIVHSINVNPCQYAVATMKGAGLRDDDLTKAFARLVRRKLKASELQSWPISPEELLHRLDDAGPLTFMFNAIAWTVNPAFGKNHLGYAKTNSASLSEKIWAMASDWQSLVTHEHSSKSTALSLIVHRLTGSKEVASLLHKLGHGISYKDVRLLTNSWAQNVKRSVPAVLVPGKPFHVTLDNSDGKQQTLTGAETTHHTNGTVFQNNATVSEEVVPTSAQVVEDADDELSDIREETQGISPPRKKQKQVLEHSISQDSDTDDETVGYLSDTGSRSDSENSETDSDSD